MSYFPSEQRLWICHVYRREILTRATDWIALAVAQLEASAKESEPYGVFRAAMEILSHSILIFRILYPEEVIALQKDRAKERAELLHEFWPGIPGLPSGLRQVRNDYEHFEERLDEWAERTKPKLGFADLNLEQPNGGNLDIFGQKEVLRCFHEGVLYFWNHRVDLFEVCTWVQNVVKAMPEKNTDWG